MQENRSDTNTTLQAATIRKVVVAQLLIASVVSVGFIFKGLVSCYSALIGGAIVIASNIYFARVIFSRKRVWHPKKFVSGFYLGETIKFIIVFALFGVVFKLSGEGKLELDALALFVNFIATSAAHWYVLRTER